MTSTLRLLLVVALALAYTFSLPRAGAQGPPPDDAALTKMLIGTWINPPGSPDYSGAARREFFNADGTLLLNTYADKACMQLARSTPLKWAVKGGMLVTTLPDGRALRDTIVSLTDKRLTLRASGGQSTYRIKSDACPTAM